MIKEKFSEDILIDIVTSFSKELASKINYSDLAPQHFKNLLFHTFVLNSKALNIIFEGVDIKIIKPQD